MESTWIPASVAKGNAYEASGSKKKTLPSGSALKLEALRRLPLALQRRLVRSAAELLGLRLEFHHVEEILRVAANGPKSGPLPHDWKIVRAGNELRFERPRAAETGEVGPEYEYS